MSDKFFGSLSKIGITDSISDFVDLSQICTLPSVNLWSRRDEVLSDVSSFDSPKSSIISNCSDSISSMTSSESDGSVISLDFSDSRDEISSNIFSDFEDLCASLSSGNVSKFIIYLDHRAIFGKYINYMNGLTRQLTVIYKYLCVQSSFNVESILKCSLDVFRKLHRVVCTLSCLDYVSGRSENNNVELLNRLLVIFKDSYSELILFNTHTCKLLSTEKESNIVSMLLELMPYLMDTLFCILLYLLKHLEQTDTKEELSSLFEKILGYCVVFCYGYLDHSEEMLNKISMLSLYRLTITFIPLYLIYGIKAEGQDDVTKAEKNHRKELVYFLKEEYLREEFIPSSVLLFKFRSEAYLSGENKDEVELVNKSMNVLESCLRSGVCRRQYPTTHIDNVGCFDMFSSSSISSLLTTLNFWLLQRLENLNLYLRRVSLLVIRHSLCTINFIERDRQFVLSYVYNCLSDEDTLPESLSIINCLSKLYPLKDGAVRKISNLTLKGSKRDVRLRVIYFLSTCCFTKKGVAFVLSIFKSLSKCSTSGIGYVNYQNESMDQESVAKIQEFMFGIHEWPAIVDALVSIANSNPNSTDKIQCDSEDFMPYIKRRRLAPIPVSSWISLLWSYLIKSDHENSQVFKSLWFSEAMIRFPRIVKSMLASDVAFARYQLSVYNKFVEFGSGSFDDRLEFLKQHRYWKCLHDFHFPHLSDHLEKASTNFKDSYTPKDAETKQNSKRKLDDSYTNVCTCIDCRMDLQIKEVFKFTGSTNSLTKKETSFDQNDSQFDSLKDVLDSTMCHKYNVHKEEFETFEILGENKKNRDYKLGKSLSFIPDDALMLHNSETTYHTIEDVDCFEYPASLGTYAHLNFSCKSTKYPSNLLVCYRPPLIINPIPNNIKTGNCEYCVDNGAADTTNVDFDHSGASKAIPSSLKFVKVHLKPDNTISTLYHGTVGLRISFHAPIVIPVKIKFYYMIDDISGRLGCVWIHPRSKF